MAFPRWHKDWQQIANYLKERVRKGDGIMAPTDFLEDFAGACHHHTDYIFPPEHFSFIVFHRDMLASSDPVFVRKVVRDFQAVFVNNLFVVYRRRRSILPPQLDRRLLKEFLGLVEALPQSTPNAPRKTDVAIVINTYNRPWALEHSLPQIAALGAPVLVVDDGSDTEPRHQNALLAEQHGAKLITLPDNRGLCCSINAGLAYWLADSGIQWISIFEDDVEVIPDTLAVLSAVQDARERPFLTGRYASEHPVIDRGIIAGHEVLYQWSASGPHKHAHRDYWAAVLPVPTPYLGAPKLAGGRLGQGSEADWWVATWAPRSVAKQGRFVVCVPGLVRHVANIKEQSTWGGAVHPESDPPLNKTHPIESVTPKTELFQKMKRPS